MTNQLRLKQIISFVVVPVLALLLLLFGDIDPENPKVTATLAVAILMATYFNDTIFLFMGGFLVALAMERWELHKRIAYKILLQWQ